MGERTTYTAEYKSKIVIEILQGEHTVSEIAARENLNVKQLSNWKREFLANAANAFNGSKNEKKAKKEAEEAKQREEELINTIGHLTVQVSWLKKNLMNYSDSAGRRNMVSKNEYLTITEQCELLEINRQTLYYKPADKTAKQQEDEYIMQRIDYWHYKFCVFVSSIINCTNSRHQNCTVSRQ